MGQGGHPRCAPAAPVGRHPDARRRARGRARRVRRPRRRDHRRVRPARNRVVRAGGVARPALPRRGREARRRVLGGRGAADRGRIPARRRRTRARAGAPRRRACARRSTDSAASARSLRWSGTATTSCGAVAWTGIAGRSRPRYSRTGMASGLGSFEKVLRVGEGRRLKRIAEQAEYVLSLQPEFEKLSDDELRGKSAEFKQRLENGESLEELLFEAYAAIREAFRRDRAGRALQGAGDGRHRPPRGRHRRDEDRRGEDVRRHAAALPQLAARRQRAPRHRQRLPRQARLGVDAVGLRAARRNGRPHREHDAVRGAQGRLRVRHHLRHELRVRLRLPARQHGRLARGRRAAQPHLRDRGRGRLDPHRRGAHAADHLRRAGDRGEGLLRLRARRSRR